MKTDIKLSKTAIEKLYEDYSRNYIVQSFLIEAMEKRLEKTLKWFTDNGYEDVEVKHATNEDFINRAKEKYPDLEEDELKNKAESLKTEYTDRFTNIPGIRHQIEELKDEILNCETVLPALLDLLNNYK